MITEKKNIATVLALGFMVSTFGYSQSLIAGTPVATDEAVTAAFGKIKFNPFLQAFMISDSTQGAASMNFRIRRAEFKFAGPVTELFRWWLMADLAKAIPTTTDTKVLQDFGMAYMPVEGLEFWIGQFKILTTDDSLEPSGSTLLPERSVMTRQTFGDRRQTGLAIHLKQSAFKIGAMVSNGAQNINDTNNAKDLSTRLELTLLQNFIFGGWLWSPDMDFSNAIIYGAFLKWSEERLMLRAEWAQQTIATVTTSGFYVEGGIKVSEQFQPVLRFDHLCPPTGFENGYVLTGGLNWLHLKHNVKIQAAISYLNNASGSVGSPAVTTTLATGGARPTSVMFTLATVFGF